MLITKEIFGGIRTAGYLQQWLRWAAAFALAILAGCSGTIEHAKTLTLATTTSTRDSGLLDVLVPMFEQQSGLEVKVIAVGSGQALEMGRRGDADVLLSHAPDAEKLFVAEGHGLSRREVMYNDFVLVGPAADPAHLRVQTSVAAAFRQIAETRSPFVSRGDDSGTHLKEKQLWQLAATEPHGNWYIEAGSGMAATLRMATEKQAYTLSDRGTFLSQAKQLDLVIVVQNEPPLHNQYSVIVVNPEKHPGVHREAAQAFADFLLSPGARKTIAEFGVQQFGQPLFFIDDSTGNDSDANP